jgi:hypothetical protein
VPKPDPVFLKILRGSRPDFITAGFIENDAGGTGSAG